MAFNITPKQLEILKLRSEGYENKEISARLRISGNAVHSRTKILCDNLGAKNITHAISVGFELGIIGHDQEQQIEIENLNRKIQKLGLSQMAKAFLLDRYDLDNLSHRTTNKQISEYILHMNTLIERLEQNGSTFL